MKIPFLVLSMLSVAALYGQAKLISFEDLEKQETPKEAPIYYYDGHPFTGMTYDYAEQENVSLEHHLANGLLTLKEGFRDEKKIEYAEFKGGLLDGMYLKWFGNGQKYVEHRYRQGRMHGMQYGWKKDGALRFVAKYNNGLELMRSDYPPPGGFETLIKE